MEIERIATAYTDFTEKFGIPRQSGLVEGLTGKIVFEPKFRQKEAVKGMEEFSHIWLIWEFSKSKREDWSATVKPPRLGGKEHVGVFATRSPHRPNPIGLSLVKLEKIELDADLGPVIYVSGLDLLNNTPILDIKPYIPYADARPEARGGFSDKVKEHNLKVTINDALMEKIPKDKRKNVCELLAQDPRTPAHVGDKNYVHKMLYAGVDVHFTVDGNELFVVDVIQKIKSEFNNVRLT